MKSTSAILMAAGAVMVVGAGAYYYVGQQNQTQTMAYYADASDPALVAAGKKLYADNCASCHGAKLEGQENWRQPLPEGGLPAPPHDETGHTWHHPDQLLFAVTKFGGQFNAPKDFKSNMPGFEDSLTDQEILSVIAYIKSTWPAEIRDRQEALTRKMADQMGRS